VRLDGELYRIELDHVCFGIIVDENVVTSSAPIGRWMVGKHLIQDVVPWIVRERGKIERVDA
jgi:hypothetical protein